MDKNTSISERISGIVEKISEGYDNSYIGMKLSVRKCLEYLQIGMFPTFVGKHFSTCHDCSRSSNCGQNSEKERRTMAFESAAVELCNALSCITDKDEAMEITGRLIDRIPDVQAILKTDIQAAWEGDPAAKSIDEIILAYPAFTAISIFRIAHELYEMDVPIVPRMMTEYAHEITGIDINPGARIGSYFFIDHGTGVVIGETTVIGAHVKIYQNVTLGARSFAKTPDGSLVKGIKRHPNIGNNVVIYAGATILGGDTTIGDNCIIGGNVWLTSSVPPGKKVTQLFGNKHRPV